MIKNVKPHNSPFFRKTFTTNLLLAKVRLGGNIAIALASSGIASTLLENGRTAHSGLKLPLALSKIAEPTCNIKKNSALGNIYKKAKLLVWDEISMAHKGGIEAMDRSLRDIRDHLKAALLSDRHHLRHLVLEWFVSANWLDLRQAFQTARL